MVAGLLVAAGIVVYHVRELAMAQEKVAARCGEVASVLRCSGQVLEELMDTQRRELVSLEGRLVERCETSLSRIEVYCVQESDLVVERECYFMSEYGEKGFQYKVNPYFLSTNTKKSLRAKRISPGNFFPKDDVLSDIDTR